MTILNDIREKCDDLDICKEWNTYVYNGKNVPRVSYILNMLHEESLMEWANKVGYGKKSYTEIRDNAAKKGTLSHNLIEEYLNNNIEKIDFSDIELSIRKPVQNCYKSFIKWYNQVKENNDIEILEIEKELVCPFVGGTSDIICKINGKVYIIDLKTSNNIGYKYFMQLGAYYYILTKYYGYNIDGGLFILQLSKYKIQFTEYLLLIDENMDIINDYVNTFLSAVETYYYRERAIQNFKMQFNI